MCGAGLRHLVLVGLTLVASTGCARLFSHYDVAPSGLQSQDDRLRRLLALGHADSALAAVLPDADAAPDDELLQALYTGILAHYAGAYDTSNVALQRAADLAEDRYTKSVSRAALSLVTSDKTLAYEPGWTERLLIHYYGALNRLRQEDRVGAAVEARRLASLLEREASRDADPRTVRLRAFLRYFTGIVFEATGEWTDADVAYRNALILASRGDTLPEPEALPDTLGEVVVVVEQAYVAHRVEQSLVVPLHPVEVEWLTGSEGDERAAAAAEVAARIVAYGLMSPGHSRWYDRRPPTIFVDLPSDRYYEDACRRRAEREQKENGDEKEDCTDYGNPYILRVAWPTFRLDREPARRVQVVTGDGATASLLYPADVSEAVVRDFEDERTLVMARTVARAISKLALTRGVERNVGGDAEWVGRVLGALTNVGTALLEQADTRSWQLLPARVGLARLRLPPGTHEIALQIGSGGANARRVVIGSVEVRPGTITVLSARSWH